ncbi:hypothetical protein BDV10DRAFT_183037 [Aspergillus recurvatus]
MCMGNGTTPQSAKLYNDTWEGLKESMNEALVRALNACGFRGESAMQPTDMSALLSNVKDANQRECASRYLCPVMTAPLSEIDHLDPPVMVIERSVLRALKQFVENGLFHNDPTVLDGLDVPRAFCCAENDLERQYMLTIE